MARDLAQKMAVARAGSTSRQIGTNHRRRLMLAGLLAEERRTIDAVDLNVEVSEEAERRAEC